MGKPLALAYSPLGDRAKLEQMLVYATLQMALTELPVNAEEFQNVLAEVKGNFLSYGQQALAALSDIFIQWQDIRRKLLVLDPEILGVVLMILKISLT